MPAARLDHNEHGYFNDNWQLLEVRKEVSGTINSNPLEQYVWHPFYVDVPFLRDYDATVSGSPTRYFYTFDANSNVTALVSGTGTAVERYVYSPYGKLTFLDGSFNMLATQQSQYGNAVTYTGRPLDVEAGLYNYRNRTYNATLGVFVQRDRMEHVPANIYEYVGSRPIILVDPTGLDDIGISVASGSRLFPGQICAACIFVLRDKDMYNQQEWERDADKFAAWFRNTADSWSPVTYVYKGVNFPSQVAPVLGNPTYCCNMVFIGHHGGLNSVSGLVSYPFMSSSATAKAHGHGVPCPETRSNN